MGGVPTDRAGFEPAVEREPYAGLANRYLQPLGHLSSTPEFGVSRAVYRDGDIDEMLRCQQWRLLIARNDPTNPLITPNLQPSLD